MLKETFTEAVNFSFVCVAETMRKLSSPTDSTRMKPKGFGEHVKPVSSHRYQQAKRIAEIAKKIFFLGLAGGAICAGSALVIPVTSTMIFQLSFIGLVSVFGTGLAKFVLDIKALGLKSASCGIMNSVNRQIHNPPTSLGYNSKCDVLTTADSLESFAWKKRLIKAAEHNILISGNYCGGSSFDEVLDLLSNQLAKKPKLKVVIISSDQFISDKNHNKIDSLTSSYPDRFQLVETSVIWHYEPDLKKTTNHTKILSIDYGRYFIQGGSGIEDKYAYAKGLGDRETTKPTNCGWIEFFLPRGFRDQDFVFHSISKNGIGRRIHIETLKLISRWEAINKGKHSFKSDSVVNSLFREEKNPDIDPEATFEKRKVTTKVKKFLNNPSVIKAAATKVFCTGPEHTRSSFEMEIIERLNQAKSSITIDHLYFHPSSDVMDALINAANRGVKVKIVTNGFEDIQTSPKGHSLFAHRTRYNYQYFASRVKKEFRKNIEVYEFVVRKTTLHKKVIVIDDYVIGGSSNLGYKSLVTMSDHEMNFVTKSQKLADQVLDIVKLDSQTKSFHDSSSGKMIRIAKRIPHPEKKLNFKALFLAATQRFKAPLIG